MCLYVTRDQVRLAQEAIKPPVAKSNSKASENAPKRKRVVPDESSPPHDPPHVLHDFEAQSVIDPKSSMSKQNSLSAWLKPAPANILNAPKPSTTQKRKRTTITTISVDTPNSKSEDNSTKKRKTTKKATAARTSSTKKAPEGKKATEQLYKRTIDDVIKKVSSLDARVKKMGPNSSAVTSDDYARGMCKFIKDIKKLMVMGPDGARCAFNLLLYIGPNAHGDLEAMRSMSGYGGTEEPFADLDEAMLEIIGLGEDIDCAGKDEGVLLPKVRHR
jgi:hypothetical protein